MFAIMIVTTSTHAFLASPALPLARGVVNGFLICHYIRRYQIVSTLSAGERRNQRSGESGKGTLHESRENCEHKRKIEGNIICKTRPDPDGEIDRKEHIPCVTEVVVGDGRRGRVGEVSKGESRRDILGGGVGIFGSVA